MLIQNDIYTLYIRLCIMYSYTNLLHVACKFYVLIMVYHHHNINGTQWPSLVITLTFDQRLMLTEGHQTLNSGLIFVFFVTAKDFTAFFVLYLPLIEHKDYFIIFLIQDQRNNFQGFFGKVDLLRTMPSSRFLTLW